MRPLPKNKKLPPKVGSGAGGGTGGRPIVPNQGIGKPKGPVKAGSNKGGPNKMFGARAGYKGVNKNKIRRLTNSVLRDEIRDLREQRRNANRSTQNEADDVRTDYQRGNQDLDYVHSETQDYLNNLQQRNQQMFAQQANSTQQATQALGAMLGETYSGAQSGAQQELARLGIQGGGNMGQLISDQANAQGVAQQTGANTQSTLGMMQGNGMQGLQMLQGMNQGSHMQGMGQNLNARNDALGQIRDTRMGINEEFRHAVKDAKGSRRDLFFQLLQQLQQTGWSQYMDQQQLNMQRKQLRKR